MKQETRCNFFRSSAVATILICCTLLVGCIATRNHAQPAAEYDLGSGPHLQQINPSGSGVKVNIVVIPNIKANSIFSGRMMMYRFSNLQAYEPRAYTQSRWAEVPGEMLRLRMQQILGEKYFVVLSTELADKNSWILLASLEDFSQDFTAVDQSEGVVQLRVTLLHGGEVLDQKVFSVRSPAPTADADGGVIAISTSVDKLIENLLLWLDTYMVKT